eukprot:augustus_masked-scaffold_55-processed-gene-1.49-mRNA-1 protein AED:1.00 eAED:1.00 QI:0/-1/0/0/-1/1/1/0/358
MKMKLGVFGAGAIGCYVGGLVALNQKGNNKNQFELVLVGSERLKNSAKVLNFSPSGLSLDANDDTVMITTDYQKLAGCDVIIVAVKSMQTEVVSKQLEELFNEGKLKEETVVCSFQNGVSNADMLKKYLLKLHISACMVNFNVSWDLEKSSFHNGTHTKLVLEDVQTPLFQKFVGVLKSTGFEPRVVSSEQIKSQLYSKLLINLINPVNAVSGIPVEKMLSKRKWRKIWAELYVEALRAYEKNDIRVVKVIFHPTLLPYFLDTPDFLYNTVKGLFAKTDEKVKSSMLQDIETGRKTEIEFLCGEVLRLDNSAEKNKKMVDLIHQLESGEKGFLTADEVGSELGINFERVSQVQIILLI